MVEDGLIDDMPPDHQTQREKSDGADDAAPQGEPADSKSSLSGAKTVSSGNNASAESVDSVINPAPHSRQIVCKYMARLATLVPARVFRYYVEGAANGVLQDRPHMTLEELEGAVLFADISGFSKLGEDLCKLHKRASFAAQALGNTVTDALVPLVELVIHYGGDVIKFAGDSIFCVFDKDVHGTLHNAAFAAARVARKIVTHSLHDANTSRTINVHCGVGVGKLTGFHVGGVLGRWEFAIAGEALSESIACEKAAGPKQAVISAQCRKLLGDSCDVTRLIADDCGSRDQGYDNGDTFVLNRVDREEGRRSTASTDEIWDQKATELLTMLNSLDEANLHMLYRNVVPYIPRPVVRRVDTQSDVYGGERRYCVTLFVRIKGLAYEKKDDIARLHSAVNFIQREMYGYHGATFCRLIVDDKGLNNLWAFGMPPLRNTSRISFAVSAMLGAINTYHQLRKVGITCAIGCSAGRVYIGTIGGVQRCEYTLHGTTVNLAARLMGKVEEGVLCDAEVFKATHKMIKFERETPDFVTVKGYDLPVATYRPTGLLEEYNSFEKQKTTFRKSMTRSITIRRGKREQMEKVRSITERVHSHEEITAMSEGIKLPCEDFSELMNVAKNHHTSHKQRLNAMSLARQLVKNASRWRKSFSSAVVRNTSGSSANETPERVMWLDGSGNRDFHDHVNQDEEDTKDLDGNKQADHAWLRWRWVRRILAMKESHQKERAAFGASADSASSVADLQSNSKLLSKHEA